ncbi:MAG: hypothetical protein MUE96_11120 [Bacteroidia bacterium]|jgi:phosphoribosylanthranilate isomerase|nr:hypothetical protein [Bacteroidia bacterium]
MQYATHIKLGKINNLSDARFAAAAGVDYIGFCFDPSSAAYITPIKAKEIIDWLTGSTIIAEFGNQSEVEMKDIADLLDITAIQLENSLVPESLLLLNKAIIKRVDIADLNDNTISAMVSKYSESVDAFQFYPQHAISQFSQGVLVNLNQKAKLFWEVQGSALEIKNWVEKYKPFGIHIDGGDEEKAGIRDFDQLNELFDTLRTEN